ncbi:oligosaccharide flippase family protein [Nocardioides houyundeii]|uniref:oligosaccharide flippase family protein n=1 Tax=Nocardioides houyundeii TaxID=2045452 RepID=UPI0013156A60|nr:oligosaccharide flippase family protein [Nocardioides houyundeii]
MSATEAPLDRAVKSGLTWSALNSLLLRVGSLVVGIVLARLLTPSEFGTFAVALTVQTLVMSLSDLGLGTQLIRTAHFEATAPTIATLGALSGAGLSAAVVLASPVIAAGMGSSEATSAIAVLGATIALGGLGVVPFALLQRQFRQGHLLAVTAADFLCGTTVSILLIVQLDMGALGLACGRLVGQAVATLLLFVAARRRPRFGWDTDLASESVRFGIPIAGANVLSWTTLGIPTPVIAHGAGLVLLGYYVLAFNVSSWPMTVLGQAIRAVALPGFSRTTEQDQSVVLRRSLRLTWSIAAPAGVALAVLAEPVIRTLYGDRWAAAWPALAALGIFGAVRVAFDLFASFLLAHGNSRAVFVVQLAWLVTLLPALVVGVRVGGILGAALAQVVVVTVVSVPMYVRALHGIGVDASGLAGALVRPTAASAAAGAAGWLASQAFSTPALALAAGALAGLLVYGSLMGRQLLAEADIRLLGSRRAPVTP